MIRIIAAMILTILALTVIQLGDGFISTRVYPVEVFVWMKR
jgi:hypothetical protein